MVSFQEIGRFAAPKDNCAIAIRTLPGGMAVSTPTTQFILNHTILEGHRFAVRPIPAGDLLLSWGMPFGRALTDIAAGEYVCNTAVLQALGGRTLDFALPQSANFVDELAPFQFNAAEFKPAPPLPHLGDTRSFKGIQRPGNRGVGTRNTIVLLGVNALVSGFVHQLGKVLKPLISAYDGIDDIAVVAHTEGSQRDSNNQELLLRTLAGFMVHPNVCAVLLLDAGDVGVTNEMLQAYAGAHNFPLDAVLHSFVSITRPFNEELLRCAEIIKNWLPEANAMRRTPQPLSALKIALQCGGSDAFSGISGNPLAAWVSKTIIQAGGAAVLAETDELIGAESYVLQKVSSAAVAERFLEMVAQFQTVAGWHGHSAHGNPSGGNLYRGLYNIYLKSLGAAAKRHPDVRLDGVLEYGQRLDTPGYYFMDSPGNDLESIAGQVAGGCNLIYFVTGNGSITNFPFVPTLKIVTTSERYALLPDEMDVNAGTYLDGVPLPQLGEELLDLSLAVAAGRRTVGEKAGHAQVQIWRNWQLNGRVDLPQITTQSRPDGQPVSIQPPRQTLELAFDAWQTEKGIVNDRVGLILPSSLCSGQIARMAAQRLNALGIGQDKQITRFVAPVHTEGCGSSTQPEFIDTLLGYLAHPSVATCLLLEHGCEKTHNDYWRRRMQTAGLDPQQFGWASVQLDGGIQRSLAKIEAWFRADCDRMTSPQAVTAGFSHLRLGIMTDGDVDRYTAISLAELTQQISAAGGTVILPAHDALVSNPTFTQLLQINMGHAATLPYAARIMRPGFHLMAAPNVQWMETMTGLGATGVSVIVAVLCDRRQQSHPFIPVLQVAGTTTAGSSVLPDICFLSGSQELRLEQLMRQIRALSSHTNRFAFSPGDNSGFQITRGQFGVSL